MEAAGAAGSAGVVVVRVLVCVRFETARYLSQPRERVIGARREHRASWRQRTGARWQGSGEREAHLGELLAAASLLDLC